MPFRIIDHITGDEAIRERWNQLCLAQPSTNPMLSWEWCSTWWKIYGEPEPTWKLHVGIWERENIVEGG
jgi:CelD/BcsL family acetyltransferase involved in cellulose biosynthesis